jgi:RNA-binding protein
MPSGELRRTLRGHGHRLSAIVQVGKGGVSDGLIKQLQQALADHELVKLKVAGEGPADRFEVAERLAALPGVNVVQIVGGAILLYKRHPSEPRYEGQRAPAEANPARVAKVSTKVANKVTKTVTKTGTKKDTKKTGKKGVKARRSLSRRPGSSARRASV